MERAKEIRKRLTEINTSTVDKCDLCGLHYNTLNIRKNSQRTEQYCDSCDRKLGFSNAEEIEGDVQE